MGFHTGHIGHVPTLWPRMPSTSVGLHQYRMPVTQPRNMISRRVVMAASSSPPIMVNSCTGKVRALEMHSTDTWSYYPSHRITSLGGMALQMGHATAEAVVRAGLQLVPVSFTGASEAVAVGNVGVSGIPVELVHPDERQSAMQNLKAQYPGLVLIDFTLPSVVNGEQPAMTCGGIASTVTFSQQEQCVWNGDVSYKP